MSKAQYEILVEDIDDEIAMYLESTADALGMSADELMAEMISDGLMEMKVNEEMALAIFESFKESEGEASDKPMLVIH